MDRNVESSITHNIPCRVALRKESVDRNDNYNLHCVEEASSLSARRAWIEIPDRPGPESRYRVALRKESVDRNILARITRIFTLVALRKESVDRNMSAFDALAVSAQSLSARRAWIEILK